MERAWKALCIHALTGIALLNSVSGYAFDNSCGVNYFGLWCTDQKSKTEQKKDFDPYEWMPKDTPPPLVELFRSPTQENARAYREWYIRRKQRTEEVGKIIAAAESRAPSYSKAVYFFREDCPSCKKMSSLLAGFQASGQVSNRLVGIGIGSTNAGASRYLGMYNLHFPVAGDPKGEIAKNYKVNSIPSLVLLAEDGVVVGKYEGLLDRSALYGILEGKE